MNWEKLYCKARRMYTEGRMTEETWQAFCSVILDLMIDELSAQKEKAREEQPSFGFGEFFKGLDLSGLNAG